MSAPEHTQVEQRSSISIVQNAKGEAQVTVKIYDGSDLDALDAVRAKAVALFRETVAAVRGSDEP